ncbi:MAG TPA: hypothetical protein VFR58_03435 [Flavisolibacter sp.]|nr:hypothetical protein [Flavisolibacter sp.]
MKLLLLFFCPLFCMAQSSFPSYSVVRKAFYEQYGYIPEENVDGINFAKKRQGWYVQVIDRVTEKTKQEQLFWSAGNGQFLPLLHFGRPFSHTEPPKSELSLIPYGYERNPYYGYPGWDIDVINDFSARDPRKLSDTLLEGLARAYSAYASRFFWLQYGGTLETGDSLKTVLPSCVLPSAQRIDSTRFYIEKAIRLFGRLRERNNAYRTIVGNAAMKEFNERVHGYMQMRLAARKDLAMKFIDEIEVNETIRNIARNYLSACALNSILFTYGDNDTYPLLFIQEKENYRKDVTVINVSLLGLPTYLNMLKRENSVDFITPEAHYCSQSFQYFLYREDPALPGDSTMPLARFVHLFASEQTGSKWANQQEPPVYTAKSLFYETAASKTAIFKDEQNLSDRIFIPLGSYILMDQFMMLDIVLTNFNKRPIYFSSRPELFPRSVRQEGMVFSLIPLQTEEDYQLSGIRKTEDFLRAHFRSAFSTDLTTGIAPAIPDAMVYAAFARMIEYYLNKRDYNKAGYWKEALQKATKGRYSYDANLPSIAILFTRLGAIDEGLHIAEQFVGMANEAIYHPHALSPAVEKAFVIDQLDLLLEVFKQHTPKTRALEDLLRKLKEE